MKTRNLLLVSLLLTASSSVGFSQSCTLEVSIANIREVKGSIRASLFTEKSDFLKKEFVGKQIQIEDKAMTLTFTNLPPGEYSLSVIHDENENGELDTNFIGIPKEGFAFGNDALGTFGPPDFDKTIVKLQNDGITKHAINLKYY